LSPKISFFVVFLATVKGWPAGQKAIACNFHLSHHVWIASQKPMW
jgi:hypothetical protein